jgi:hypothetical protein
VTDAGLDSLAEMASLKYLNLTGTKVTLSAEMKLQRALPSVSILSLNLPGR